MAMDGQTLGGVAKVLENTAEEFALGTTKTERNESRDKMTDEPFLPYIVLALGIILLGAGLGISLQLV